MPACVQVKLKNAWARLAFSRFGQREAEMKGLPAGFIPHAVDMNVFRPRDRALARKSLSIPVDAFVVGMVAANQFLPSRKALPQSLDAFAAFRRKHPKAILYLHTAATAEPMPGVNLPRLAAALGISDAVMMADQYQVAMGVADSHMAEIYSAFDVLLAASMGEGFGLPILEAQACGCPVISGNWTSMPEHTFSGELIPESKAERFWTAQESWQFLPHVSGIVEALEAVYGRETSRESEVEAVRDAVRHLDVEAVVDRSWKPALREIETRIREEAEASAAVALAAEACSKDAGSSPARESKLNLAPSARHEVTPS
jgi:glycosyltransferase involved in cell wall biosynthesis